jgi:hypothetical protein
MTRMSKGSLPLPAILARPTVEPSPTVTAVHHQLQVPHGISCPSRFAPHAEQIQGNSPHQHGPDSSFTRLHRPFTNGN